MKELPITCYCANKNGAKWLDRTLKAISFCKQIIFLDDNSSDNSIEIAKKYTNEIYLWTGKNSMSERRNYCIGFKGNKSFVPDYVHDENLMKNIPKVKYKWILQLDSDELFSDNTCTELNKLLNSEYEKRVNTIAFTLDNLDDKNNSMGFIPIPRMFRTGTVYWKMNIQNEVKFKEPVGSVPSITIKHYGYSNPEYQWIKQYNRLPFLEEDVRNNPDDFERRKYLINALTILSTTGDNFERVFAQCSIAVNDFLKSKELNKDYGTKVAMQKIIRFLFHSCGKKGDMNPFLILCTRTWEYISFIPDPWYWMFFVSKNMGDFGKVIYYGEGFFETIKKFKPGSHMIELTTISNRYEVAETLEYAYRAIGDMNKSYYWKKNKIKYAGKEIV